MMAVAVLSILLAAPSGQIAGEGAWLDAVRLSGLRSVQAGLAACHDPKLEARWKQVDDRRIALIEPLADWLRQNPDKLQRAVPPLLTLPEAKCPEDKMHFDDALIQYSISVDQLLVVTKSGSGRTS